MPTSFTAFAKTLQACGLALFVGALGNACSGSQGLNNTNRIPARAAASSIAPTQYRGDSLVLRAGDSLLLDALGQVYVWDRRDGLTKHFVANTLAGVDTSRFRYTNVQLGQLQSIDVSNPLRPLLFYGDAQTLVYLQRNLSELRRVNLLDLGLGGVDAVAYAPGDGFWAYAADRQRLLLLDENGVQRQQSVELSQLFGQSVRALEVVATTRQVSLAASDGRILLFGPFGAYRTQLLRPGHQLQANDERLVFCESGQWYSYSGARLPVVRIEVPQDSRRLVAISGKFSLWRRGDVAWVELGT